MTTSRSYAGFWSRFAALFIDVLILLIPQAFFGYLVGMAFVNRMASIDPVYNIIGFEIWSRGIALGVAWLYFAILESSKYQATVGKMVLGIVVTDMLGNPISFSRATGRFFGKLLSSIILGVGYIMVGFTPKKQALHDILAKCLVLKKVRRMSGAIPIMPVASPSDDEQLYLAAQNEIDNNTMREGLWAKAFEQSPSDENLRRAAYLKLRVAQLRANADSNLPPPVTTIPFKSTAFGKWLQRDDAKVLLIIGAIIVAIIIGSNYKDIGEGIRNIGVTSIEGSQYEPVSARYFLNGQEMIVTGYTKISYRGDTIYCYGGYSGDRLEQIIRGASAINVYKKIDFDALSR